MLPNICMTVQGWKNAINVLTQYTIIIRKYFNAVMHIAQGLYCARHIIIITIAIIVAMKCKRPACAPVTTNRISIGHGGAPRAHTQRHNHKLDCKKKIVHENDSFGLHFFVVHLLHHDPPHRSMRKTTIYFSL